MRYLLAIACMILSFCSTASGVLIDRIVAVVDDEPITWSELYKRTAFELMDQIATLTPEEKKKVIQEHQAEVLKRMIDMKILLKEARKEGISVTNREIKEAIKEILKRNNLTESKFAEVLKQRGISMDFYKNILREQILAQRYETLKLKDKIRIDPQEVQEYLQKKGILPEQGESVILRQIFIPLSKDSERILQKVMQVLSEGISFEEVARRYSQGSLAQSGGYLGTVKVNELSPPLRKALEGLSEGQYSRPVRTDRGYIILYLEKRLPSYEAYKRQAQEELFLMKLQRMRDLWLSKLRKEHYIEILL